MIETNRLLIREWTDSKSDLEALHEILSSSVTMHFWPAPFTPSQTKTWIQTNIKRYERPGFGRMAIVLKEQNKIIGDCGIVVSTLDSAPENDLGYIIDWRYWQNGFAFEAAKALIDYAFYELSLTRLCANMPFDHIASIKTAEKLGMKREKEFYNKRNRDILTYLYSISKL